MPPRAGPAMPGSGRWRFPSGFFIMIKTAAAVPAVSAGKAGFHRDSTGKEQAALRRPEGERSRQMRWLKKIIEAVITWCREFYRGIRKKYGISEGDGSSLRSPRDLPAEEVEAYMKRQGIGSGSGGTVRRHIIFRGRVQGVGFRYQSQHAANAAGVTGWVRNNADGSVEMEAQGTEEAISRMLLFIEKSSWIVIHDMDIRDIPVRPEERSFKVTGY